MIVTTAQLYKPAYGNYAVGAYNINNMEQLLGLFNGNVRSKAPFIIQLSKGARKYADKRMLEAMIRTAEQMFPEAIFAVHLDHGDEKPLRLHRIRLYSSGHDDASHSHSKQLAITKRWSSALTPKGSAWKLSSAIGRRGEDISRWAMPRSPIQEPSIRQAQRLRSLAAAIARPWPSNQGQPAAFEVIERSKLIPAASAAWQLERARGRSAAD